MKKRNWIFFYFLFIQVIVSAQENCPVGYEERNVLCSGKLTKKCVQENYTCSSCWEIQAWQYESWSTSTQLQNSFEAANDLALSWQSKNSKYVFRIVLNDKKFCSNSNGTLDPNALKKKDLIARMKILYARLKKEINDARNRTYTPGKVIQEYQDNIQSAEDYATKLEAQLSNLQNQTLEEIQQGIDELNTKEAQFTSNISRLNEQNEKEEKLKQQKQAQDEQQQKATAAANNLAAQRQQQIALLDQSARQQAKSWEAIGDAIGSIGDFILKNMMEKDIRSDNAERNKRFTQLQEMVNTKSGTIIDCSECNGKGFDACNSCDGNGYKPCVTCNRTGKLRCYVCGGTGSTYGRTCSSCGGSGSTKCNYCFGKGKNVCTDCNALGKKQCIHCRGTGKEFKEGELADNSGSSNDNNSDRILASSEYQKTQEEIEAEKSTPIAGVTPINTDLGIGVRDCLTKAGQYQKDEDYTQAIKWYKMAADQDVSKINCPPIYLALAQNNLAEYYRQGVGTPKNLQLAFIYYKKAATIGFMPSFYLLARCYENGDGTEKNLSEAINWYKKAAEDKYNFSAEVAKQAAEALKRLGQ
jgi:hypothetical protein